MRPEHGGKPCVDNNGELSRSDGLPGDHKRGRGMRTRGISVRTRRRGRESLERTELIWRVNSGLKVEAIRLFLCRWGLVDVAAWVRGRSPDV